MAVAVAQNILPDEPQMHVVEKAMSVNDLMYLLYEVPSAVTVENFKRVNSHLTSTVSPGQVVLITPANSGQCTLAEELFKDVARRVDNKLDAMSKREREQMAKYYDFLNGFASYTALGSGMALNYVQTHMKGVESILKDIEQLYVKQLNTHGNLRNSEFFKQRKMKFTRLNQILNRLTSDIRGSIAPHPSLKHSLGLSSKSLVHQFNKTGVATGLENFDARYDRVGKMTRVLARTGLIGGIALDGLQSYSTIQKACLADEYGRECSKAYYTEGGRFSGSVLGGVGAGSLSALACGIVFSGATLGGSFIACSIVVGGASGYLGGSFGGKFGTKIGVEIYDYKHMRN